MDESESGRLRVAPPERPSLWSRVLEISDEIITEAPCVRFLNKGAVVLYFLLALWLGWQLLPLTGNWDPAATTSKSAQGHKVLHNYFGNFGGFAECNIRAAELYMPPPKDDRGFYEYGTFCHDRKQLLQALSGGGRIGFDAPYTPRGCNYRWFDVEEICFILERFDALIFVGDDMLHSIYSAINVLLRQDLALGALDASTMDQTLKDNCRCANQFVKQDCRQHFVEDAERTMQNEQAGRPYFCNRLKHGFINIDNANPSLVAIEKFKQLAPKAPRSRYQPIPIIHSLAPSTMSANDAATSLLKFVELADDSERNTPILWIGPTAAGHIELKGRKGNQEIWDFDRKMASTAKENDVEVLGMWNMTVQATSWDGVRFGEKVAITQAMTVMNWLSRLQSS